MAYDEQLAECVRERLAGEADLGEKRMFGGLAFLIGGRMAVAVSGAGGLMLRIDPADGPRLRALKHVGPMVMRGREMDAWLRVEPDGCRTAKQLDRWIGVGVAAARAQPPK